MFDFSPQNLIQYLSLMVQLQINFENYMLSDINFSFKFQFSFIQTPHEKNL